MKLIKKLERGEIRVLYEVVRLIILIIVVLTIRIMKQMLNLDMLNNEQNKILVMLILN
jgi:membrane-anchored glycerophosphoryl diester phosphodiesterase (GDPDase)